MSIFSIQFLDPSFAGNGIKIHLSGMNLALFSIFGYTYPDIDIILGFLSGNRSIYLIPTIFWTTIFATFYILVINAGLISDSYLHTY